MSIREFKYLRAGSLDKLEEYINSHLDGGWQPHLTLVDTSKYYVQAMVRTNSIEPLDEVSLRKEI